MPNPSNWLLHPLMLRKSDQSYTENISLRVETHSPCWLCCPTSHFTTTKSPLTMHQRTMHHAKDNTTFAVAKDTFQGENECSTDMKQEANNIQGAEGSVIHSVDDFSGIITHQHFKIYKPAKVLTQFVFKHRKRKKTNSFGRYIGGNVSPKATIAIGRLDVDVEGLLLLTTDGKISEKVRRKSVEKEYWVQVDDQITEKAIERPQRGIEISLPSSEQHINSRVSNMYTTLP